ncbi:hypothetical protein MAR_036512 [Mya arenaria]|uniref:Uncharacterized protein n=1 Tax=Mya arenaria TaxID=6604 RepID=A0ABY7FKX2_MYAAR|nr:hypothetical protein MAR_036512 [Mya arenaria]
MSSVKGLERCLLGRPAIQNLCFVKINTDKVICFDSVNHKYPNLFNDLRLLNGEYNISQK